MKQYLQFAMLMLSIVLSGKSFAQTQDFYYIDTAYVQPTVPTDTNNIKIIVKMYYDSGAGSFDSHYTINGNQISISEYFNCFIGAPGPVAHWIDTVSLGHLPQGDYSIKVGMYCYFDLDTFTNETLDLSFSVQFTTNENELFGNNERYNFYPNPSNEFIYIESLSPQIEKNRELVISDITGRVIKEFKLSKIFSKTLISVADLEKGIYLFVIKNQDNSTIICNKIQIN